MRPEGDFYETPYSLVWSLADCTDELDDVETAYDPCAGSGAIVDASAVRGITVTGEDWYYSGKGRWPNPVNFYDYNKHTELILTNFPFSEWDNMVRTGLRVADKVITIGRVNYFGTHARNASGLWKHLKAVYVFDRMIDYRADPHPDGLFYVGALVTGWFIFEKKEQVQTNLHVLDVQKYAKLGAYTITA